MSLHCFFIISTKSWFFYTTTSWCNKSKIAFGCCRTFSIRCLLICLNVKHHMYYKIAVWLLVLFAHYYAVDRVFWVVTEVFSVVTGCCYGISVAMVFPISMQLLGCPVGWHGVAKVFWVFFFSTLLMYAVARVFCWLPRCCLGILSGY